MNAVLALRQLGSSQAWCIRPAEFGLGPEDAFRGVLCLECDYANPNGYWVLTTRRGEGIGIDHLTGG